MVKRISGDCRWPPGELRAADESRGGLVHPLHPLQRQARTQHQAPLVGPPSLATVRSRCRRCTYSQTGTAGAGDQSICDCPTLLAGKLTLRAATWRLPERRAISPPFCEAGPSKGPASNWCTGTRPSRPCARECASVVHQEGGRGEGRLTTNVMPDTTVAAAGSAKVIGRASTK